VAVVAKTLQIDPGVCRQYERRLRKKAMHKWMRRAWKRDPENAPRRYEYGGYC
jgi:hypothetical protein